MNTGLEYKKISDNTFLIQKIKVQTEQTVIATEENNKAEIFQSNRTKIYCIPRKLKELLLLQTELHYPGPQ